MAKKKKNQSNSVKKDNSKIAKYRVDESKIKNETTPNAVVVGGWEEIGLKRITAIDCEKYLLMHPAVPRGIEKKVNQMVSLIDKDLQSNVLINKTKSDKAKQAMEYCKKVLLDSKGPLFIRDMGMGAFRYGTSYAVLQTDQAESQVLKFEHQHEVFFGPARYPKDIKHKSWGDIPLQDRPNLAGKMKIDPKTKEINKFVQYQKKTQSKETNYDGTSFIDTRRPDVHVEPHVQLVPFGREFDKSEVATLLFDRYGDEPLGIPLIQFLHLTIQYLLNMEKGAAQTQVNFGFNKWKAMTPFKSQDKLQQFSQSLSNINTDAVVCLPDGITLDNIQPGQTDFDKVHPIFMKLIAIRLGIPLSLLSGDGTSTNKSTVNEQKKDMYEDFIVDEISIEYTINDLFWKACKIKFWNLSHEELEQIVPSFRFKQPREDDDVLMDRNLKFSLMIRNFLTAASDAGELGLKEVVEALSIKVQELLDSSYDPQQIEDIKIKYKPKQINLQPKDEANTDK